MMVILESTIIAVSYVMLGLDSISKFDANGHRHSNTTINPRQQDYSKSTAGHTRVWLTGSYQSAYLFLTITT